MFTCVWWSSDSRLPGRLTDPSVLQLSRVMMKSELANRVTASEPSSRRLVPTVPSRVEAFSKITLGDRYSNSSSFDAFLASCPHRYSQTSGTRTHQTCLIIQAPPPGAPRQTAALTHQFRLVEDELVCRTISRQAIAKDGRLTQAHAGD